MDVITVTPRPGRIPALQFTGDNWAEMHEFTGHRTLSDGHTQSDVFTEMGVYLGSWATDLRPNAEAELWTEALGRCVPISSSDWVLKFEHTFAASSKEEFSENWMEVLPPSMDEPTEPGFYYNEGSAQVMIYLLTADKQWWAITDSLQMNKCVWGYIEQTIEAYPLRKLTS